MISFGSMGEQKLQTALQTGSTVPILSLSKMLTCLVADAVRRNCSPRLISLLTGKITGNFANSALGGGQSKRETPARAISFAANPYSD
jgi:hypothetical protein